MSVVVPVVPDQFRLARPSGPLHGTGRVSLSLDRRGVRVALALLWFLDGALQLQPAMFTRSFADQVVAPAATGQPSWVAWLVLHSAHLVASHPFASDLGFALVQLLLGLLLLVPRTARAALVASVVWATGVWVVGEGLGGIAGGTASILTGAPGAALLYGVLALAAWPLGGATGGLGRGEPAGAWFPRIWAALWVALGLSTLLPANGSSSKLAGQLTQVAGTVPAWLGRVDDAVASVVRSSGPVGFALLVAVPLAVGLCGLGQGRIRRVAAWGGVVVALATWVVGESFGQLGSGSATDPNTGPLLVVAALALLGTVRGPDRPPEFGHGPTG